MMETVICPPKIKTLYENGYQSKMNSITPTISAGCLITVYHTYELFGIESINVYHTYELFGIESITVYHTYELFGIKSTNKSIFI